MIYLDHDSTGIHAVGTSKNNDRLGYRVWTFPVAAEGPYKYQAMDSDCNAGEFRVR